jgi:hypothetical protein
MQTRKFGKLGSGDLLAKPQGNQSSSQSIAGSPERSSAITLESAAVTG